MGMKTFLPVSRYCPAAFQNPKIINAEQRSAASQLNLSSISQLKLLTFLHFRELVGRPARAVLWSEGEVWSGAWAGQVKAGGWKSMRVRKERWVKGCKVSEGCVRGRSSQGNFSGDLAARGLSAHFVTLAFGCVVGDFLTHKSSPEWHPGVNKLYSLPRLSKILICLSAQKLQGRKRMGG